DSGGLFLSLPWRDGRRGDIVNAARQRNDRAAGQRAMWIDASIPNATRSPAHVAIFDYPDNSGYPQAWRLDQRSGIGATRSTPSVWTIKRGDTEIIRHQLIVYTGALDDVRMDTAWADYSGNRSTYATSALWN